MMSTEAYIIIILMNRNSDVIIIMPDTIQKPFKAYILAYLYFCCTMSVTAETIKTPSVRCNCQNVSACMQAVLIFLPNDS